MKIEIFGKPNGANGPSKMIGYCSLDMNKSSDGRINFGYHHLQINSVPSHEPMPDWIGFQLLNPSEHKKTLIQQEIVETEVSEQYFANDKEQYNKFKELDKTEDMHIWIDATRFLPDNCSITKIIVKIWDNNMKE